MNLFQPIEGECAIIVTKGVFYQVDLYRRDGDLYVQVGRGFAKMMADGSTTKAHTRWDSMTLPKRQYTTDSLGRLLYNPPKKKA